MRKLAWLAAAFAVWGAGAAEARSETPRKGGTIRMTAPYGTNFASLDMHATPRAQDDIFGKAIHRTLYNWDSANNKPVLELATSVTASNDGLIYTYKLRDDAFFHNGRKMTADDIICSFTRIMDGSKGFPGARYVRIIKGAVDVEKGAGQGDLRPEEDRRLHARDDAHRQRRSGLLLLRRHDRDPARRKRPRRATSPHNPVGLGPFKFKEHIPGSRLVLERWDKFYKPGKPYADRVDRRAHGRGRRRATSPSATRRSTPRSSGPAQYVAYRDDPSSRRASSRSPRCSRAHGHEPRRSSRSPTSACARRSTTRSTPT